MPPIGTAVGLPPGAPDGVRAHAEPHAELEQPRKGAGRGQSGHETLQDAEPRIGLHDANEPSDGSCGHQTVRIEHDREVVARPPALAEIADIAGLEAGVVRTATVANGDARTPGGRERGEMHLLGRGD